MFYSAIKKQCCIRESIEARERIDAECMSIQESREILNGKKFSEYETYELLVQASLLIPFLIIFVTQILITSIKEDEYVSLLQAFAFSIFFLCFSYIVHLIAQAKHDKKYRFDQVFISLGIFLFIAVIALEPNVLKFVNEHLNWIWILLIFFLGMFIIFKVYAQTICSDTSEHVTKIYVWVLSIFILLFCILGLSIEEKDYTILLMMMLYSFLTTVIFLHNQFLNLLNINDKNIDLFRIFNGDYIEDQDDYFEGNQPY